MQTAPTPHKSVPAINVFLFSYASAAFAIILCASIAFGLTQYTLHQETVARQVYTLLSGQLVRSQRLERNSLLLLSSADRHVTDAQMSTDLAQMQAIRSDFAANYSGVYPQLASVGNGHGAAIYNKIVSDVQTMLRYEAQSFPTLHARLVAEYPAIGDLFYTENTHVQNLQQALAIVDDETNAAIIRLQIIETVLFVLTLVVMLGEYLIVIRPANKTLHSTLLSKES